VAQTKEIGVLRKPPDGGCAVGKEKKNGREQAGLKRSWDMRQGGGAPQKFGMEKGKGSEARSRKHDNGLLKGAKCERERKEKIEKLGGKRVLKGKGIFRIAPKKIFMREEKGKTVYSGLLTLISAKKFHRRNSKQVHRKERIAVSENGLA